MTETLNVPNDLIQLQVTKTGDKTNWQYLTTNDEWQPFGGAFAVCTSADELKVHISTSPDIKAWIQLRPATEAGVGPDTETGLSRFLKQEADNTWVIQLLEIDQSFCCDCWSGIEENGKVIHVRDPSFPIQKTKSKPPEKKPLQKP